jgi:uncharacterized membrane protein HdeD (DUF308 family)
MLVLGVILIIVGLVIAFPILITIGVILAIVGAILLLIDVAGHRQLGGRRWY